MTGKLAGKVALITGASAGIGWSSALALAQEGANMVLTARRNQRLEELEKIVGHTDARPSASPATPPMKKPPNDVWRRPCKHLAPWIS